MHPRYFDFLFKPALKEIFVKFRRIYSRDENGKAVRISLTHDKAVAEYCNKIKIGETLEIAIRRSLKTDFGLDLVDFDLWTFGIDMAKNKKGETLSRIPVATYVKFAPLKSEKVVRCTVKWVDREDEALSWINKGNDISQLICNSLSKEELVKFVMKLYELGTIDVYMDTLEEPEDVVLNTGLGIRLPVDIQSRKNIFALYNDMQRKKLTETKLETDIGQNRITLWLS